MRYRKLPIMLLMLALVCLSLTQARALADEPKAWTPELSMKLKGIGVVRVSPDGKRVAYVVTQAVMTPEKSEYLAQIHMANADGSDAVQLTFAEKSSTNPQWSPDSKWLAFTSSRAGKNNLYLLRAGGGEAEQLTDVKGGVSGYEWSPDGQWIAFLQTDPASEAEEKSSKGKDDWRWVDENAKHARLRDRDGPPHRALMQPQIPASVRRVSISGPYLMTSSDVPVADLP